MDLHIDSGPLPPVFRVIRRTEAEPFLVRAHGIISSVLGKQHDHASPTAKRLGGVYEAKGDPDKVAANKRSAIHTDGDPRESDDR
ncbi:MAG: tetratricopeptide repeat protein [Phycisphaerales bacterium]|nr:MAG: tetratricopeptide repeat protein [Phycisphaerales bacterium]